MHGNPDAQASAGNAFIDFITHLRLQHFKFARQIDRDFALLAVDRAEFDRDFESVLSAFAAPVTRHRLHVCVDSGKVPSAIQSFSRTPLALGNRGASCHSCHVLGGFRVEGVVFNGASQVAAAQSFPREHLSPRRSLFIFENRQTENQRRQKVETPHCLAGDVFTFSGVRRGSCSPTHRGAFQAGFVCHWLPRCR